MKTGSSLALATLGVISLAHLIRVLLRIEILFAGFRVPIWMSLAAFLFLGTVTVLLFLETRKGESR